MSVVSVDLLPLDLIVAPLKAKYFLSLCALLIFPLSFVFKSLTKLGGFSFYFFLHKDL